MARLMLVSPRSKIPDYGLFVPLEKAVFSKDTLDAAGRIFALQDTSKNTMAASVCQGRPLKERLFDARAEAKQLISRVAMHLKQNWREGLFRQIDSMHDPDEWNNDDKVINPSSFLSFLRVITQMNPERRPGLGMSYTGNVIAAWTKGKDRLTIEFQPEDRVRWILSKYSDDDVERVAGQTTIYKLQDALAPYHIEQWVSQDVSTQ